MANNIDNEHFMKPVEIRRRTDQIFILVFPLCFVVWLGIGIAEIFKEEISLLFLWLHFVGTGIHYLIYGVAIVLGFLLLSLIFSVLKEYWLVFVVEIFIIGIIFTIITCILLLCFVNLNARWLQSIVTALLILSTVSRYNITTLICTRKNLVASLEPMTREPFRAIANSFLAPIISFVILIFFSIVVFAFTVTLLYANLFILVSKETTLEKLFISGCIFAFALTGMGIFNSIWNFGFMITADYFAPYYGNERVSRTSIGPSIARVSRYHLGTIGFLSIPIWPSVYAIIMVIKRTNNIGLQNNTQSNKKSDGILINIISKISLIMSIPEYALIQTSVHGSDAFKSTRQMVDLHSSNPSLFLTLNAVFLKIADLSMIISIIYGQFAFLLLQYMFRVNVPYDTKDSGLLWIVPLTFHYYSFMYFVHSIITLLVRPAMCTFTVYKMIRNQQEYNISSDQTELIVQ